MATRKPTPPVPETTPGPSDGGHVSRTLTMATIGTILPGAKRSNIIRAIKTQGLPGRKLGREWYFDAEAVRQWLAERHEDEAHQNRLKMCRVQRQGRRMSRDVPDEIGET